MNADNQQIKVRGFQFTTLQTGKELGLVHFRKDVWGCYQGQGKKIGQ